jgi:hypothetical protein
VGLNDVLNKVKQWAGKNPDKANQGIDKGSTALKGKFAGHDQHFDTASDKAKSYLTGGQQQGQPPAQPGAQPPAPPA